MPDDVWGRLTGHAYRDHVVQIAARHIATDVKECELTGMRAGDLFKALDALELAVEGPIVLERMTPDNFPDSLTSNTAACSGELRTRWRGEKTDPRLSEPASLVGKCR